MTRPGTVAIVGATGACGRQLAAQLLGRAVLTSSDRIQFVTHAEHASERAAHGFRADLADAYADSAPTIELIVGPDGIDADVVVMLAGATLPTDPTAAVDRVLLARTNRALFAEYATALARRADPPLVVVQSNPVELGVEVFADAVGRHRVVGAAALSDTLRFRRELAVAFGVQRPAVTASVLGQHGDHAVPVWSGVRVEGVPDEVVAQRVRVERSGRTLADLPEQIVAARTELLGLVAAGDVHGAFGRCARLPADLRAAVKPFLVHYSTGHTTEIVTAHSVAEIVEVLVRGVGRVVPAQVLLEGELGLRGAGAVPVRLGADGWTEVVGPDLADDERAAVDAAFAATRDASRTADPGGGT